MRLLRVSRRGPIPARAGEPVIYQFLLLIPRAYPRSRGGTVLLPLRPCASRGLSPLARGNLVDVLPGAPAFGPIPARAGEPIIILTITCAVRAYPRSRGGTLRLFPGLWCRGGLSPLARGNLAKDHPAAHAWGPIPARAGEPISLTNPDEASWAYPRSRGGTCMKKAMRCLPRGLSPLARGNPGAWSALFFVSEAYPRSRGGTQEDWTMKYIGWGLSPLARGNRCARSIPSSIWGPIPARAGEPFNGCTGSAVIAAYPRSRGGTDSFSAGVPHDRGLSPLARGNRDGSAKMSRYLGPIPARAGEPGSRQHGYGSCRAYPRSRGGTHQLLGPRILHQGLSPLARGNLTHTFS